MTFSAVVEAAAASVADVLKKPTSPSNNNAMIFLVLSAFCLVVPLDLTQLIFACLGAVCYYFVQRLQRSFNQQERSKKAPSLALPVTRRSGQRFQDARDLRDVRRTTPKRPSPAAKKPTPPAELQAQSPVVPVVAPTFHGVGPESEMKELIEQIMPTAESQRGVDRLAEAIRFMLSSTLPEVEVTGFASSDLSRGRANGVAVPDVDIVINVSPAVMASKLAARPGKNSTDPRMLQKWALRTCADKLVSAGGFKFRRSGFRGNEPKMTLLVPAELGIFNQAVPIDIAVNAVAPLHSAALLTESGNANPRAKELILLVRRWAKDRGICHSPKGHFSPYIWSLLSIYFLQVKEREEGPLLPPLQEMEAVSKLFKCSTSSKACKEKTVIKDSAKEISPVVLLREFMHFYAKDFDWKKQAICVRNAATGSVPLTLPIHIILHDDGVSTEPGPSVEDPFEPNSNLGDCMNAWSFQRMKTELMRASELLSAEESLSKLLEPWTPDTPASPEAEGKSPSF